MNFPSTQEAIASPEGLKEPIVPIIPRGHRPTGMTVQLMREKLHKMLNIVEKYWPQE